MKYFIIVILLIQVLILSFTARRRKSYSKSRRDLGQKCVNHNKAGEHAMGITAYNTKKEELLQLEHSQKAN